MLHTQEPSATGVGDATNAAWVRCRSRIWKVLDVHEGETSHQWRLSRWPELARTFAAPPDVVRAVVPWRRRVSRAQWARGVLEEIGAIDPVWWPAAAARLPITPFPYQYVPAMAILSGHHRRILVADEVGMGKTVQAGILLHEIHAREPDASSLVVVPAALVPQWVRELRTRLLVEPALLDADALRREALHPQRSVDASRAGTCWLISLDLLRQPEVTALLVRTMWTVAVIDEAHLAAPGTARLDAIARVAASSVRVLLLTATPHAAGPPGGDTLRGIGSRPGEGPMLVLHRQATLLERPARRTRVLRVDLGEGHGALCARLDRFVERARRDTGGRGLLPALVLRRRASSCPAALVRSLDRRLQVLGSAPDVLAQPCLFDEDTNADEDGRDDEVMRVPAWGDEVAEREELRRLLALARRLPADGRKLRTVARLLRRCREPAVVFTAFVDTLRALRSCLDGRRIVMVHGRQPDALRAQAIDAFTSGEADVLLTTDASAEGLNLHARCRLVVHTEVPVSARTLLQRTGRVDRHGQTRRVHAVVIGSDSVEDEESLIRLGARAGDEASWIAGVSNPRCARTMVAARRLEVKAAARKEGDGGAAGGRERPRPGGPGALVCVLRRRAWTRIVERATSLPGTSIVWVGALRCGGAPMLSTFRVPVAIAGRAPVEREPDAALQGAGIWHTVLPHALVRVRRLAARLAAWERDAEASCNRAAAAQARAPGLFDDARNQGEGRRAPVAVGGPRIVAALEIMGVLERRR